MTAALWRVVGQGSTVAIAALASGILLVSCLAAEEPDEGAGRRCLACGTAQRAALESLAPQPVEAAGDDEAEGVAVTDLSSIRTGGDGISSRRRARELVTVEARAERFAALLGDTPWPLLPLALKLEGLLLADDGAAVGGGDDASSRSRQASRQPASRAFPPRVNPLR